MHKEESLEKEKVTILSSFATDTFLDQDGKVLKKSRGGPALFVSSALVKEEASFHLITHPEEGECELMITPRGAQGKMTRIPRPVQTPFGCIKTPFIMISTLIGEFDLRGLSRFQGKAFLDVQGYVNDPVGFGKKRRWEPDQEVMDSIFCLKGTEAEIMCLPEKWKKDQQKKVLLITKGERGCEAFIAGEQYPVVPLSVVETNNTVGAGDTFFAHCISAFIRCGDMRGSMAWAVEQTAAFLAERERGEKT